MCVLGTTCVTCVHMHQNEQTCFYVPAKKTNIFFSYSIVRSTTFVDFLNLTGLKT